MYILPPEALAQSSGVFVHAHAHTRTHALDSLNILHALASFLLRSSPPPHPDQPASNQPDEVAAEDEAEHEDKDACTEDDHVDVEGKVLETDRWH